MRKGIIKPAYSKNHLMSLVYHNMKPKKDAFYKYIKETMDYQAWYLWELKKSEFEFEKAFAKEWE